jgi:hypothetical protein
MNDPTHALRALLEPGGLSTTLYPPNSRYHGIGTAALVTRDGRTVVYLRRRLVPPAEAFTVVQMHTTQQGDRPDNLAHRYLGDPEQFWRLCDGNGVISPDQLVEEPGRPIAITLPHGVTGRANA